LREALTVLLTQNVTDFELAIPTINRRIGQKKSAEATLIATNAFGIDAKLKT